MTALWDRPDLMNRWKRHQGRHVQYLASLSSDITLAPLRPEDVAHGETLLKAQAYEEKLDRRAKAGWKEYEGWDEVELAGKAHAEAAGGHDACRPCASPGSSGRSTSGRYKTIAAAVKEEPKVPVISPSAASTSKATRSRGSQIAISAPSKPKPSTSAADAELGPPPHQSRPLRKLPGRVRNRDGAHVNRPET
jgi:hypothetical protein